MWVIRSHPVAATTGILALLTVGAAVVDEQRQPGPLILATAATETAPPLAPEAAPQPHRYAERARA
jgi:hypothetical protein